MRLPRQPVADDPSLPEGPREGEEPLFSRPAEASPFGKGDDRLDVTCSTEFKARVSRVARLKGHATSSAWARSVLEHQLLRDEDEIDRIVTATGGDNKWRNR
jgi:hypothetical protein